MSKSFLVRIGGAMNSFSSFTVPSAEEAAQAVAAREPELASDEAIHVNNPQGREIIHIKPNAGERWIRRGIKGAQAFDGLGLEKATW